MSIELSIVVPIYNSEKYLSERATEKVAEKENEIAVSIVQEATHAIAEYILTIIDELEYNQNN